MASAYSRASPVKKSLLVLGGGLAGIAAASALSERGYAITLVERHRILGGRASAFPHEGGWLDNCQHVLLGCCVNLLHLLQALNTRNNITFHKIVPFLANGKTSTLGPSQCPVPFHFLPAFLKAPLFSLSEKLGVIRLFSKLLWLKENDEQLDSLTMLEWLQREHQSKPIIDNFWNLILISTLNETLERTSAKYGIMVLRESFLPDREAALLGVPNVSLTELYHQAAETLFKERGVKHVQGKASRIAFEERPKVLLDDGTLLEADELISALPFYNLLPILPDSVANQPFFSRFRRLEMAPILGIHLWFSEKISDFPFGGLPGSPIHWFFVKPPEGGLHYVQLVVSACRDLMSQTNEAIIQLGLTELRKYVPGSRDANLLKAKVVREARATFSPAPGCDAFRPSQNTPIPHFYLAGDWTDTGWPSTMEGAVRSGYRCAEAVLRTDGVYATLGEADLKVSRFLSLFPYGKSKGTLSPLTKNPTYA